jgi:predicted TIM-barrel fold metal-dependent hydrolase
MIVDCHTHINFADDNMDTSAHFEAAQTVDACIVLATADGQSEKINEKLAEYVKRHRERMIGFAVVEPIQDKVSVNNIKAIKEKLGLKGVVLYCCVCGFHPTYTRAMQLYESANELELPVFFHNGDVNAKPQAVLDYAQPYLLDEVARTFPALKIIIGSMGVPFVEQTLAMVAKHENVYADLTIRPNNVWQTYNIVVAAHERGVMDKLLFGSGFPNSTAGQCIETLLGFNMLLADTNLPTVPRSSIRNIIERNTIELLGIEHTNIKPQDNRAHLYAQGKPQK